MTVDNSKVSFWSGNAALKLVLSGSGSGTIPATGSPTGEYQRVAIPHGQGTDKLLFRVLVVIPGFPAPYNTFFVTPYAGATGSAGYATASVDGTNLYIEVGQSGNGLSAQPFSYYYRVLFP